MSLIDITNLTFAYDGSYDNIFENVSFQIDTAWRLGFTGRNGRGKTTFLNLLLGRYEYSGSISSSVDFEYFPFEVRDDNASTLDVAGSITRGHPEWELLREMSLLELDEQVLHRPFCTLSNGEQTKMLLVALFLRENRFLLIDEPTNHLDMHGRKLVSRYLRGKDGYILVSHDRAFLDGCIDHILSINRTGIEIQRGNFSTWLVNKERQDSYDLSENEKLKKDIGRLAAASKRTSSWSDRLERTKYDTKNSGLRPDRGYIGHKAAKMMSRSKAIEARQQSAMEEKSKLLKNIESAENLKITQLPYHANRLVSLENVSIFYGEKTVCRDISLTIERGDRVALGGRNGSGKSSIAKLICTQNISYTGTFSVGSNLVISYVPQDTSSLRGDLSDYAQEHGIDQSIFKAILRKLDFSRVQFDKDMSDLSGGQKKKVLLARSLCEKSHLLIWDEPLNFIDVISRMQIEALLLEYKPTILFIEHDSKFCENISTKTVRM